MRIVCALLVGAALFMTQSPAKALELGLTVGARLEAGLDGPTRELLRFLAGDIRKQFVAAVDDILPKLNDSFDKAVTRVDDTIAKSFAIAQCKSKDVVDHAAEKVENAFSEFFSLVSPTQQIAVPRSVDPVSLLKRINDERNSIGEDMNADEISAIYARINLMIGEQMCVISGLSDKATTHSMKEAEDISDETEVWLLLSKRCGVPQECFKIRHTSVEELLKVSDSRDVDAGQSRAAFSSLERPNARNKIARLFVKFDRVGLEQNLVTLLQIERSIAVAKAVREDKAQKKIEELQVLIKKISAKRKEIRRESGLLKQNKIRRFKSDVRRIRKDVAQLESEILRIERSAKEHTIPLMLELDRNLKAAARGG